MNLRSLDLKLLTVFDAVLRKRSLTAAAESLGLSQPAISQSLAKLRNEFADPLFVRTTKGMSPTPRATQLAATVRQVLDLVRDRLDPAPRFDPAGTERTFTLAMSDIGMVVFVPKLIERLKKLAPKARLRMMRLESHGLREGFEEGQTDLAIGSFPTIGAGIRQQRLYADDYACLVRQGHPSIKSRITQKQFREAHHIVATAEGTGHAHSGIAKLLAEKVPASHVAIRVPSFVVAPMLVAQTDYVLTVPYAVCRVLGESHGLRALKPPFVIPKVEVRQYWHERYHRDAANKWLRELVHVTFGER